MAEQNSSNGPNRTRYQEGVIRRYYQNRDTLMLQKLGDLVGDLYLSQGAARDRIWKRVAAAFAKPERPQSRIEHLIQSDNPEYLAKLLQELQDGKPN